MLRPQLREGSAAQFAIRGGPPAPEAGQPPILSVAPESMRTIFVPLREGPTHPRILGEVRTREPTSAISSTQFKRLTVNQERAERGVDTRQVRSKSAAPVKPYRRGSRHKAVAVGKDSVLKAAARITLSAGMFAMSSRRTLLARRNTIRAIIGSDRTPPNEVTSETLLDLAASLNAGGYRSAYAYLVELRLWAVEAGQDWTDKLQLHVRQAKRSIQRGLGPPRRALAAKLETFKHVGYINDGPMSPREACLIGALWLMRGAELRAVLGDQVEVSAAGSAITIHLAATKTDPSGTGAPRRLRCTCGLHVDQAASSSQGSDDHTGLCPVGAMNKVLRARHVLGLGSKDILFATQQGSVVTHNGLRTAMKQVLGSDLVSEHSLRRSGAQHYARQGAPLREIQHLGRWGTDTMLRYVEEAEIDIQLTSNILNEVQDCEEEKKAPVVVEPIEEETSTTRQRDVCTRIRSCRNAVHAADPGEKKTVCGWKYLGDSGWAEQSADEQVTCGKCLRVWRQRGKFQVGEGKEWRRE